MTANERVVRAVLEAINRHDPDGDQPYLAEDLVYRNPAFGETDKPGWRAFHVGRYETFPDFRITVERTLSVDDTVVMEARCTGTHRGKLAGIPPTNRAVEWQVAFVVDVEDGKIRRWHSHYDAATILRQIGALPTTGAPRATTARA